MPVSSEREYRMMTKEVRALGGEGGEARVLEGYATTFNDPYTLWESRADKMRVVEVMDPHAFDNCDMGDVILQCDHEGRVYARTRNGTLTISTDGAGLKFKADMSKTESAGQLHEEVRAGMLDRMSIGMVVDRDERTYTRDETTGWETCTRRILAIRKLYDISVVSIPANEHTVVTARSLTDGVIRQAKEEFRAGLEKRRLMLKIKIFKDKMEGKNR